MSPIFEITKRNKNAADEFFDAVRWQVEQNHATCFDDLCESDQLTLVGLLLKAMEGDLTTEWYCEHKDSDVLNATLANMLISGKKEDAETFLEQIKKNAINYHAKRLNTLIEKMAEEMTLEKLA